MANTKVYYNSACPVCKAGVESQQGRMQARDITDVEWIDVHTNPDAARDVGAELEFVRERLHVKRPDGSIGVGADAFAALWARTPGQKRMAQLLRLPGLHALAVLSYNAFARALYRWNRKRRRW